MFPYRINAMTNSRTLYQIIVNDQNLHSANIAAIYSLADKQKTEIRTAGHFGSLMKSVRKSKKQTQQQLADLAGVGRRFIVECEAGKPRLEFAKVLQVAAAAGIDIFAIKR